MVSIHSQTGAEWTLELDIPWWNFTFSQTNTKCLKSAYFWPCSCSSWIGIPFMEFKRNRSLVALYVPNTMYSPGSLWERTWLRTCLRKWSVRVAIKLFEIFNLFLFTFFLVFPHFPRCRLPTACFLLLYPYRSTSFTPPIFSSTIYPLPVPPHFFHCIFRIWSG